MSLKKIDVFPNTSMQISDSARIMMELWKFSALGSYIYSDFFQSSTPTWKQSL